MEIILIPIGFFIALFFLCTIGDGVIYLITSNTKEKAEALENLKAGLTFFSLLTLLIIYFICSSN